MTTVDPLKSVISIGNVDDTSLALPSVDQCASGQRRVLEQVQTVRRTRSKLFSSRSASASLSPASPVFDSVFVETSKYSTSNGGLVSGNGFSKSLRVTSPDHLSGNWQLVSHAKGSSVKRSTASAYQYERGYGSMSAGHIESDAARQCSVSKRSVPPQRFISLRSIYGTERAYGLFPTSPTSPPHQLSQHTMNGTGRAKTIRQFTSSQVNVTKTPPKPAVNKSPFQRKDFGSNGNGAISDISMKEAVEYLSSKDETYQHCGASYIQHNTFVDDKAKDEVLKHKGIPPLVALLSSSSSLVNQTASAALRNLSFKSDSNKEEMHNSGGIEEAVALLRDTDSVETQKQLTGLLWNLSSAESLKPDLLKSALPVLMERAILPYSTGPDRISSSSQDPEVFFNATACLRNLSSTKQSNRKGMRKCRGLVDSLVSYIKECVDAGKPDDKSAENCVCILHNLTFQLEEEAPSLFSRITMLAKTTDKDHGQSDTGPIGCFSPQSKTLEREWNHFDFPIVEDPKPSGAGWLIHSQTLQSYLSLLCTSQREETQEACCGVLQNLTASESIVSAVMGHTIVQKLNGLKVIVPLLNSNKVDMQRNAVALVGNLIHNPNLHNTIARKALPELLSILRAGTKEGNESDDTLAVACHVSNCLLMKEPETCKHLLNHNLINSLKELSQNGHFPKSSKAAALLLYNLWSEKDLQSVLKKQGMCKSSFVNDVTTAAHRSAQVID